jgi:protein-export membrane protein SecD
MFQKLKPKTLLFIIVVIAVIAGIFDYQPLWGTISNFRPWNLGLDLAGGSVLTYNIDLSKVPAADEQSVVNGLRDVIEKRVNLFGVSEPKVYIETVGSSQRLVVELAGIKDVNQAIQEIGATPFLDFREVQEIPATSTAALSTSSTSTLAGQNLAFIPTGLNGRYVVGAQMSFNSVTNQPQVDIEFNSEGATLFQDLTSKNVGKPIAIFLDNQLIEMPVVQETITGGKAEITGNFTVQTAQTLVERFNAGALPAPITLVNQQTISSNFGKNALDTAILAGIVGTLAVMIFMLIYYKKLGIFASGALLIYIAITLAIFKIVPVTMTLSGIAGFILSIGMAVDANVLVFERTKEELQRGLSHASAVEEGFKRAWTSIRDSNVSTLITSAVLYYFTSSFVQGFALSLFIGVLVSLFSAITTTRTLLRVFESHEKKQLA